MSSIRIGVWVRSTIFGSIGKVVAIKEDGRVRVDKVNGGIGIWSPWAVEVLN